MHPQIQAAVEELGRENEHLTPTVLGHWADIVELFLRYDADPRVNRESPINSRIRETFSEAPEIARKLEKCLATTSRKWRRISKFIAPQGGPPPTPSFELAKTILSESFGFRRAQWKRVLK